MRAGVSTWGSPAKSLRDLRDTPTLFRGKGGGKPLDSRAAEFDPQGMKSLPQEILVLDLFSGIGGLSLGLHWAGMRTQAFCEADPFARRVLARHWPGVPIYDDVRTLSAVRLRADGVQPPHLLCGGFPCQDISLAGRAVGIEGPRSGLWTHMARLVRECRPHWVVVENVPGLRSRGADRVLSDLEAAGYTCWPLVVGAVHAAAPTAAPACGWWPKRLLPTPVARDWKHGSLRQQRRRRACQLNDAVGGRLQPSYAEWMMGFPAGWTKCGGLASKQSGTP